MRYRTWLARVTLVTLIAVSAAHPWRPAVGAAPIVPGVGLADIQLGMPIAEVLARFGTPSVVRLTGRDGVLGYGFDQYGITVYTRADVVQAIATTNSVVGSVDDIGLGTSTRDVVRTLGQAYAPGTIEGYPGIVYGGLGVAFGLDRDAVASILVFRPIGATPAQPTSPGLPAAAPSRGPSGVTAATGPAPAGPASTRSASVSPAPAASVSATGAQAAPAGQAGAPPNLRDVAHLKAYTADTHFLSLAGYVRYLVHDVSKTWITPDEGRQLMQQDSSPATP